MKKEVVTFVSKNNIEFNDSLLKLWFRNYFFNDNNGAGIDFSWDPESEVSELMPTALKAVNEEQKGKSQKVLRDGQLYIMYEGQMYDVQGKKIED